MLYKCMQRLGIIILLSLCVTPVGGQSLALPLLRDVVIFASIHQSEKESFFFYDYTVVNGERSTGSITSIDIDISTDPSRVRFDTTGLEFRNNITESDFRSMYAEMNGLILPIGFPSFPIYWLAGLSVRNTATFGGSLLEPGEEQSGFIIMSKAPPGIRNFVVKPRYDPNEHYPPDEEETYEEWARIDSLIRFDREVRLPIRGKTVGPVAPPRGFDALEMLETIRSYSTESLELGWIANRGILQSLQAKLDNAERQLERGNTIAAVNVLQAFVNEVEALPEDQLSSEAYALLKYNAEYLIRQLEAQ